jgi:hypothetical protein
MAAAIPATVPVFTVLIDDLDDILAEHQNTPNDEISALATLVGMIGSGLTQASSIDYLEFIRKARQSFRLVWTSTTVVTASAGEIVCTNAGGTQRVARKNTSTTAIDGTMLDTGSASFGNSKVYYVWAIADALATTVTFKVSESASLPASSTRYGLVGKFATDSSGNVLANSVVSFVGEVCVQTIDARDAALITGSVAIPKDNTKPQIGEGDLGLTLDGVMFTDTGNTVEIDGVLMASANGASTIVAALFQDTTADAIACGQGYIVGANQAVPVAFSYKGAVPTSTAKVKYTVRFGGDGGATNYLGGANGSQLYNGTLFSWIRVKEWRKVYL